MVQMENKCREVIKQIKWLNKNKCHQMTNGLGLV